MTCLCMIGLQKKKKKKILVVISEYYYSWVLMLIPMKDTTAIVDVCQLFRFRDCLCDLKRKKNVAFLFEFMKQEEQL